MQFFRYVAREEQEFTTSVNLRIMLIFFAADQIKQPHVEKDPKAETVSYSQSFISQAHTNSSQELHKIYELELSGTGRRQTLGKEANELYHRWAQLAHPSTSRKRGNA